MVKYTGRLIGILKGGPGSGNTGHAGIPGHQGGSQPKEGKPYDISAEELGTVYHGSKGKIKIIDPEFVNTRDYGYYGEGFYVTSTKDYAKSYGRTISEYTFMSNTRILRSELNAKDANEELVKDVLEREYELAKPRIQGNPQKEANFRDYLESLKSSPPAWARAVYAYGKANGYDVIMHSSGEIVVLNYDKLVFKKELRGYIIKKGGPGSGNAGHAGIPGHQGGSQPKEGRYDIPGGEVTRVRAGTLLSSDLQDELKQYEDGVRIIYNVESRMWHIANGSIMDIDHGNFSNEALDDNTPEYTEEIQARGVYDINTNTMILYDFRDIADSIYSESGKSVSEIRVTLRNVMKDAASNSFYITGKNGRTIKPIIDYVSINEIMGFEKQKKLRGYIIKKGSALSGNRGHKGIPGHYGGSAKRSMSKPVSAIVSLRTVHSDDPNSNIDGFKLQGDKDVPEEMMARLREGLSLPFIYNIDEKIWVVANDPDIPHDSLRRESGDPDELSDIHGYVIFDKNTNKVSFFAYDTRKDEDYMQYFIEEGHSEIDVIRTVNIAVRNAKKQLPHNSNLIMLSYEEITSMIQPTGGNDWSMYTKEQRILAYIRYKGGKGSGHFQHRGRPGRVGGSQGGIAISLPRFEGAKKYSNVDLDLEDSEALKTYLDYTGPVNSPVNLFGVEIQPISIDWSTYPGGWTRLHPKAIHNSKIMISEMTGYSIIKISDDIAAKWIRGIYTQQEVLDNLRARSRHVVGYFKGKAVKIAKKSLSTASQDIAVLKGSKLSGNRGHRGIIGHRGGSLKRYTTNAGYVAQRHNDINDADYVLYDARKAMLDTSGGNWTTVCEKHSTLVNHATKELAYYHLPTGDWCEECQAEMNKPEATKSDPWAQQQLINIATYEKLSHIEHGRELSDVMMNAPYHTREDFITFFNDTHTVPRADGTTINPWSEEKLLYAVRKVVRQQGTGASLIDGPDFEKATGLNSRDLDYAWSAHFREYLSQERTHGLYQFRLRSENYVFDKKNGIISKEEAINVAMKKFGYTDPGKLYDYLMGLK